MSLNCVEFGFSWMAGARMRGMGCLLELKLIANSAGLWYHTLV